MSYFGTIYSYTSDELPTRAKTVYMYLKDRSDAKGECWPAINTIARETSMSRSTVKRGIADLIRCGLLRKEPRYRENGSNTSIGIFSKNDKVKKDKLFHQGGSLSFLWTEVEFMMNLQEGLTLRIYL